MLHKDRITFLEIKQSGNFTDFLIGSYQLVVCLLFRRQLLKDSMDETFIFFNQGGIEIDHFYNDCKQPFI